MPRFRIVALLVAFPALFLLFACTANSARETGFRDDVLIGHPVCGVSLEDPCRNIRLVSFRIFANSDVFSGAIESTQEYLEGMMPSKIGGIFSQSTTFTIIGLPFTRAGSSSNADPGEVVVVIMYIANPEEMVEPMLNLVISSEATLSVRQAVCDAVPAEEDLCQEELRELMEFYFTSEVQ